MDWPWWSLSQVGFSPRVSRLLLLACFSMERALAAYTHQPTDTNCVGCHGGQYLSQGTNGGAMGAPHNRAHMLAGNADCNTCHTAAATTFLNWLLNCR